MIANLLNKISRRIRNSSLYTRFFLHQKQRDELHDFWRSPTDGNQPEMYIANDERLRKRSDLLVQLLGTEADRSLRILEVGCNAGRNLKHLFDNGFHQIEAIEISENAVALFRERFPEAASQVKIHVSPVEEIVRTFADNSFDVVFTMAVLEHIHTDSAWIFDELARIAKTTLITIEDEKGISWRHFPRNYREIFEPCGLVQVHEIQCEDAVHGLGNQFFARVFKKG